MIMCQDVAVPLAAVRAVPVVSARSLRLVSASANVQTTVSRQNAAMTAEIANVPPPPVTACTWAKITGARPAPRPAIW